VPQKAPSTDTGTDSYTIYRLFHVIAGEFSAMASAFNDFGLMQGSARIDELAVVIEPVLLHGYRSFEDMSLPEKSQLLLTACVHVPRPVPENDARSGGMALPVIRGNGGGT
jgi:hypothetical protein